MKQTATQFASPRLPTNLWRSISLRPGYAVSNCGHGVYEGGSGLTVGHM